MSVREGVREGGNLWFIEVLTHLKSYTKHPFLDHEIHKICQFLDARPELIFASVSGS